MTTWMGCRPISDQGRVVNYHRRRSGWSGAAAPGSPIQVSDQASSEPVPAAVRGQSGQGLGPALPAGETTGRPGDASRFAKALSELGHVALAPADRLTEALSDPARRHRTMAFVAVIYALAWTLYAVVSKSSHDLHPDMAETVILMREWALGLSQASAGPDLARGVVVHALSAGRLGLLPAGRRLARSRALSIVHARRRMARWPQARVGAFPARRHSILQFPRAAVRPQRSADSALGVHDLGVHALARHPSLRVGRADRSRRRGVPAHQILVGVSAAGAGARRCFPQEPHGLFPLAGTLVGCIGRGARLRASRRLARPK